MAYHSVLSGPYYSMSVSFSKSDTLCMFFVDVFVVHFTLFLFNIHRVRKKTAPLNKML